MSGRGIQRFVTTHRTDESDKLVKRVSDGIGSQKYKQVDYEQLKALAARKKLEGQEKLQKVKKLKEASKQGKDNHLLKQHRGVWTRELNRLKHALKKAEVEMDFHISQNSVDGVTCAEIFKEFGDYEIKLEGGRDKFRKATVDPIEELREDLQYWLHSYSDDVKGPEVLAEHARVTDTIFSVKDQQCELLNKLHREIVAMERQLQEGELPGITQAGELSVQHGIPTEAFELECPEEEFKASVLQEFILMDDKYVERLDKLEREHRDALRSGTGGWLEEEHKQFLLILEQYPHDVNNRRMLYIDRMKREFPHKNRQDIVAHEEWWMLWRYYHERRRDLIHDWKRDRHELLNRVKVVFTEACSQYELAQTKEEHVNKQQELCKALYDKVGKWREKKMEALRLQLELEEKQHQIALEKRREEEEREKQRREADKGRINQYKKEQDVIRRQGEEMQRRRLEELQIQLAEQAKIDQERVKFREEKYLEKVEDIKRMKEERETEKEEQEKRLEALREKVRPQVECDLLRVWSDTEAWHSHMKGEEEVNIQKPMYQVNTFTAKQVTSDPRYKLEQKLRAAGLQNNAYARQVMMNTQGHQAARRDMQSTLFKHL